MTVIDQFESRFGDKESKYRSLRRLVVSEQFAEAYNAATNIQKKRCYELLDSEDIVQLRKWVKSVIHTELEGMTWEQIREEARKCNIPNYSRLHKRQLIVELQKKKCEGG